MLQGMDFCHLLEIYVTNIYRKQLLDTWINASKKVIHKAAEATGEFLGNKIADIVTNLYNN